MMFGLILIVQLVHYPTFRFIEEKSFAEFEKFHCRKIRLIVLPVMSLELLTCIYLAGHNQSPILISNLFLLVATWILTLSVQGKIHQKLLKKYSTDLIESLICSNWTRTLLWGIRVGLLTYYVNDVLPSS